MGLGLLGRGVGDVRFLAEQGAKLVVTDRKTTQELAPSLQQLADYPSIHYTLGGHRFSDFEDCDFVLKAAGVPKDSPYLVHARSRGIPVYMSTALFARLSPARIIGVTGTRGKTTVTYMLHHILRAVAVDHTEVFLGGNVQGVSTLPLLTRTTARDTIVLELDSWQLQGFGDLAISPHAAVFTTFMSDHQDYYSGDLTGYFGDKANIYLHQEQGDTCVIGTQVRSSRPPTAMSLPTHARYISAEALPVKVALKVPGEHNRYNAALAYEVAGALGVEPSTAAEALSSFTGVEGRLQPLGNSSGVEVYNDTAATTPHAVIAALKAVGQGKNTVQTDP